eukprot:5315719-Pleurochrysis_carterae.AAC.3
MHSNYHMGFHPLAVEGGGGGRSLEARLSHARRAEGRLGVVVVVLHDVDVSDELADAGAQRGEEALD